MKLGIGSRDKVLISVKKPNEVGYAGGCTSTDPHSCWVIFGDGQPRFNPRSGTTNAYSCFVKSSRLPGGGLSFPPEFVSITKKNVDGKDVETIRLPVLDSSRLNSIHIGGFPGGETAQFTVHFRDGTEVEFIDNDTTVHGRPQKQVDVSISGKLNVYRKKFIRDLARRNAGKM